MTTNAFDLLEKEHVGRRITLGMQGKGFVKRIEKNGVTYYDVTGDFRQWVARECVKQIRKWGYMATKQKEKALFDEVWVVYAAPRQEV